MNPGESRIVCERRWYVEIDVPETSVSYRGGWTASGPSSGFPTRQGAQGYVRRHRGSVEWPMRVIEGTRHILITRIPDSAK